MYMHLYVCLINNGLLYNSSLFTPTELLKCRSSVKLIIRARLWGAFGFRMKDTYRWHYKQGQRDVERLHFVIWSTALTRNEAFCLIWLDELFVSRTQVYSFLYF